MPYEKKGSITVTFQDGTEHEFTSIEKCAGLDPADVVEVDEVDADLSHTSTMPVQNKTITGALDDKADLEDGKVPSSQLPSYVDDVVEYATYSNFPATGEQGKIYLALDTGFTYRWSGSTYVRVNEPDLSNYYTKGQIDVKFDSLTKADVGLGNVDNTSDLDKPISTATQAALDNKQDVLTTSIPDGENESFIGFDNDNELKKEKLLVMSPIEIINAVKGTYDPSKEYASLTVNDDPMSYGIVGGAQKSAVGDGNATMNKLVGVNAVRNQQVRNPNFANTLYWDVVNGSLTVSDNIGTYKVTTVSSTAYGNRIAPNSGSLKLIGGHKYLFAFSARSSKAGLKIYLSKTGSTQGISLTTVANTWVDAQGIVEYSGSDNIWLRINNYSALEVDDEIQYRNVYIIDLTQALGSNEVVNAIIGTTASTQVANLLKVFPQILTWTDFDAGTLVSSKSAKLLSGSFNRLVMPRTAGTLNGQNGTRGNAQDFEEGKYYVGLSASDYVNRTNASVSSITDNSITFYGVEGYGVVLPVKVVAGQTVYFNYRKTGGSGSLYGYYNYSWFGADGKRISGVEYGQNNIVTVPYGAVWFVLILRTTNSTPVTVSDLICNISYTSLNGIYKPYKEPTTVPLPNVELNGILTVVDGKVVADGDEAYPDGTGKQRHGIVDLGTLDYARSGISTDRTVARFSSTSLRLNAASMASRCVVSSKLRAATSAINADSGANLISLNTYENYVYVTLKLSDIGWDGEGSDYLPKVQAYLSGVYYVYPLATPTDFTLTSFQSIFPVEQGGTLQFLDEDDNPIAGLQGSEITYLSPKGE